MIIQNKIVVISAPSGSGKTSILKKVMLQEPSLTFSVSITSREPRSNETDGVDYHFISKETFKNKINSQEMLEWEEVYNDAYYGTLKSDIQKIWKQNKIPIFDIDVIGALNLKEQFKESALLIFLEVKSINVLKERLTHRNTDSEAQILKRLEKANSEMKHKKHFDHVILNDVFDDTVHEVTTQVHRFIHS